MAPVMASPPKNFLSPAQYLEIERAAPTKSEYHAGEMFAMAGVTHEHSLIVGNVAREIGNCLRRGPCQVHSSDLRVHIPATGLYTYPDILAFCGDPEFVDDQFDTLMNPQLLIEVLSESTEAYDRGTKFRHYRTIASLKEIVFISQYEPRVERYVRTDDEQWVLKDWTSLDESIQFESIGCIVSMADIYERVDFQPPTK